MNQKSAGCANFLLRVFVQYLHREVYLSKARKRVEMSLERFTMSGSFPRVSPPNYQTNARRVLDNIPPFIVDWLYSTQAAGVP